MHREFTTLCVYFFASVASFSQVAAQADSHFGVFNEFPLIEGSTSEPLVRYTDASGSRLVAPPGVVVLARVETVEPFVLRPSWADSTSEQVHRSRYSIVTMSVERQWLGPKVPSFRMYSKFIAGESNGLVYDRTYEGTGVLNAFYPGMEILVYAGALLGESLGYQYDREPGLWHVRGDAWLAMSSDDTSEVFRKFDLSDVGYAELRGIHAGAEASSWESRVRTTSPGRNYHTILEDLKSAWSADMRIWELYEEWRGTKNP